MLDGVALKPYLDQNENKNEKQEQSEERDSGLFSENPSPPVAHPFRNHFLVSIGRIAVLFAGRLSTNPTLQIPCSRESRSEFLRCERRILQILPKIDRSLLRSRERCRVHGNFRLNQFS
jgi:hypothetical protein